MVRESNVHHGEKAGSPLLYCQVMRTVTDAIEAGTLLVPNKSNTIFYYENVDSSCRVYKNKLYAFPTN